MSFCCSRILTYYIDKNCQTYYLKLFNSILEGIVYEATQMSEISDMNFGIHEAGAEVRAISFYWSNRFMETCQTQHISNVKKWLNLRGYSHLRIEFCFCIYVQISNEHIFENIFWIIAGDPQIVSEVWTYMLEFYNLL